MADSIHRVTMFKIPALEDQKKLMEQYETLSTTAQKDGKLYIQSITAGVAEPDQRSQGFTVVCKTQFESLEDMRFYDEECKAHKELKSVVAGLPSMGGLLTVYFHPAMNTSL